MNSFGTEYLDIVRKAFEKKYNRLLTTMKKNSLQKDL